MLLGGGPGPIDDRAALVHEPLARLKRLLLVEQRAGELLDLAPLLRRRFGREPAQRLGDKPLPLGLGQSAARSASRLATTRSLAARTFSAASTSLARSCESCASRTAADCAISWSTCWALLPSLGPQRLDLGDPALVLGDDPCTALVRDAEERALELSRDPLQLLGPVLDAGRVVGSGC